MLVVLMLARKQILFLFSPEVSIPLLSFNFSLDGQKISFIFHFEEISNKFALKMFILFIIYLLKPHYCFHFKKRAFISLFISVVIFFIIFHFAIVYYFMSEKFYIFSIFLVRLIFYQTSNLFLYNSSHCTVQFSQELFRSSCFANVTLIGRII